MKICTEIDYVLIFVWKGIYTAYRSYTITGVAPGMQFEHIFEPHYSRSRRNRIKKILMSHVDAVCKRQDTVLGHWEPLRLGRIIQSGFENSLTTSNHVIVHECFLTEFKPLCYFDENGEPIPILAAASVSA